ncbi:MAG: helix-turn-helix domain-containing protein [Bacteroidota bacterium]
MRITDVCFESGFKDISNFSKAFSKTYGLSPSEYRNQHSKPHP